MGGRADGTAHLAAARPRGGAPPPRPSIGLTSGGRAPCNPLDRAGGREAVLAWGSERRGAGVERVISAGFVALGKVKRRTFPRSLCRGGLAQSLAARVGGGLELDLEGEGGTGAGGASRQGKY